LWLAEVWELPRHTEHDADDGGETGHQHHKEEKEDEGVAPVLVDAVADEDGLLGHAGGLALKLTLTSSRASSSVPKKSKGWRFIMRAMNTLGKTRILVLKSAMLRL